VRHTKTRRTPGKAHIPNIDNAVILECLGEAGRSISIESLNSFTANIVSVIKGYKYNIRISGPSAVREGCSKFNCCSSPTDYLAVTYTYHSNHSTVHSF